MSAKKSTYVPAKVLRRAKFQNGESTLLVLLTEGKSGFNTKATVRKDKGADAETGGRASFKDEESGVRAFDKLAKEAEKAGWTIASSSRNAFTEIPAPPVMKTGSKKHVVV